MPMSTITPPPYKPPEPISSSSITPIPSADDSPGARHLRRLWRGPEADPAWARPCLWLLLGLTTVLYVWGLSASGWANAFYSAAAQAGSASWKAFFFGSSDAANSITVDKPPASLWPMALSVRAFGLSSWSILLPQALMGVATVAVLHATLKRHFGALAGLVGGAALALTPVAALMFRYNNPDALLTLLLVVAAWTALRAVEDGRTRWFVATGALVGLGFLTKQLQVLLVVPGFALAGLVAGRGSIWQRSRGLLVVGVSMLLGAGWWIAVVELVPATWRPYIGGSQDNSFLELTFGYNGLGRITGDEVGSVGGPMGSTGTGGTAEAFAPPGGVGGAGFGGTPPAGMGALGGQGAGGPGGAWGQTGWSRLFDGSLGGQVAWLIPAAVMFTAVGLWWLRRRPRTDMQRASIMVWSVWLLVTAAVFSFMGGIFHEYYTIALAPAIAALVGLGVAMLWERRDDWSAAAFAAAVTAVSGWWAVELLGRAEGWNTWLGPLVGFLAAVGTVGFAVIALLRRHGDAVPSGAFRALGSVAMVAALAGPTAWTLQTVSTPHSGSIVLAGPLGSQRGGPGGGMAGMAGMAPGAAPGGVQDGAADDGSGALPGGAGAPVPPNASFTPPQGFNPGTGQGPPSLTYGPGAQGGPGGAGGLLDAAEPSEEVRQLLVEGAEDFDWVAATVGANNAAGFQLATELPVMPIGGFNGSDPSPTLEEFKQMVADGRIHWFISTGGGFPGQSGGSGAGGDIDSWVSENFEQITVDGTAMYDLTSPTD
jgi:4-amino-4-deoxy-L-arabinose transferase-like glycosyltransferase